MNVLFDPMLTIISFKMLRMLQAKKVKKFQSLHDVDYEQSPYYVCEVPPTSKEACVDALCGRGVSTAQVNASILCTGSKYPIPMQLLLQYHHIKPFQLYTQRALPWNGQRRQSKSTGFNSYIQVGYLGESPYNSESTLSG